MGDSGIARPGSASLIHAALHYPRNLLAAPVRFVFCLLSQASLPRARKPKPTAFVADFLLPDLG
jgi:hypothetical protein